MELRSYLDDQRVQVAGAFVILLFAGFIGSTFGSLGSSAGDGLQRQTADYAGGAPTTASLDLAGSEGESVKVDGRKKATRVSVDLKVEDVEGSQNRVSQLVENFGGMIDSTRYSKRYGSSGYMTVRIPENRSNEFLSELEKSYPVESRSTDTEDVTDTYTETNLELENKRQELRKLEQTMNDTDEVESLIKIQERMSELRSRIQYLENRLSELDRRTEYTRIQIDFEEKESFTSEFQFRQTVTDSYRAVFDSLKFIILGIGYLVPFGLLYILWKGGKKLKTRLEDRA